MKTTKEDKVFSTLIRLANNFTCENCFFIDSEAQITFKSRQIHLSHFIGRGNYQVRWNVDNGYCLCATCHAYYEDRPSEHTQFVTNLIGKEKVEHLEWVSNQAIKWTKQEREDMYTHYKNELAVLTGKRMDGFIGRYQPENFERDGIIKPNNF